MHLYLRGQHSIVLDACPTCSSKHQYLVFIVKSPQLLSRKCSLEKSVKLAER